MLRHGHAATDRDQSRPFCQQSQSPQYIYSTSFRNLQIVKTYQSDILFRFSRAAAMVRNHPENPFQRRILVDRTSSSYTIQSQLVGAIHGRINAEMEQPATLLVLSFRFLPHRANLRIKSVSISVEFLGGVNRPTILAIAPEGQVYVVSQASA
jgi:hypothetical protein